MEKTRIAFHYNLFITSQKSESDPFFGCIPIHYILIVGSLHGGQL